jgi:hypothetical protein
MATIHLPPDFKDFLQLLNSYQVEYLLIGGYAVGYHGYPRATGDMDTWIAIEPQNAEKVVAALKEFGFDVPELSVEMFLQEKQVIRMGVPPIKIDITTSISGVSFAECYAEHQALRRASEASMVARRAFSAMPLDGQLPTGGTIFFDG